MEKRNLGKDFTVSAVGMGCMGLSHAYGVTQAKISLAQMLCKKTVNERDAPAASDIAEWIDEL